MKTAEAQESGCAKVRQKNRLHTEPTFVRTMKVAVVCASSAILLIAI
jgi:hypothetical protein